MTLCFLGSAITLVRPANADEDPEARAHHRFIMRASEDGKIPMGALARAKQQLDAMRRQQKAATIQPLDAGIMSWEWLGPGNVGGRIRAILIHPTTPQVMWIGGVAGGIWRTNDGGASWAPVDDFMANLAVTSLAVDPTNTLIMYAATGEGFPNPDALQGAGIFKSTDGGLTWSQLPSTSTAPFAYVNRLAHHPSSANTFLAATANGQVYKTTNGGASWTLILDTLGSATDVKYHPTNPARVMVGTSSDLYYSTDGGTVWTRETSGAPNKLPTGDVPGPGRCEVAFSRSNQNMYVSMNRNAGEIWRAAPVGLGAATWTRQNTGSNYLGGQGGYGNAVWADPINPNVVIVGGIALWFSSDGGSTLTQISSGLPPSPHNDHHAIVSQPGFDGASNRVVFVATDGGIYKAQDIAVVTQTSGWTNLNNSLGITQFYGGAAAADGNLVVGGAQDTGNLRYRPNLGVNGWRDFNTACLCDGGVSAVDYTDNNIVYGESQNLAFGRSDDGAQTWTYKTNGLTEAGTNQPNFIAPFSMDPNTPTTLIAGGRSIWRTTNRGDNWTAIRPPLPSGTGCSAIDIAQDNSNRIWVGYNDGTVSRTLDGGSSWINVDDNATALPNRAVTDIAINPFNAAEVIVTVGGYKSDDVWLTSNDGGSWTRRTGSGTDSLPAVQVNSVRYNPQNANWIYIGTDLGVFASEDKGLTWGVSTLFQAHDGPINVEVDELFWQGTEYLVAATHGRGMFRSKVVPTVYVDINNLGFEDGTLAFPFNTIQEGINAAGIGATVSIKAGIYPDGTLTSGRRVNLAARDGVVEVR